MTTLEGVATEVRECNTCGTVVPLQLADDDQAARRWRCGKCGEALVGHLIPSFVADDLRSLQPETIPIDRQQIAPPSTELEQLAYDLSQPELTGSEQRHATRHVLIRTLAAQQLGDELMPVGEPFHVVSRNISTQGIAILNTRAIECKFLVLELDGDVEPLQVLLQVLRQRPRGRVYEIAGRLVTRLARLSDDEQDQASEAD